MKELFLRKSLQVKHIQRKIIPSLDHDHGHGQMAPSSVLCNNTRTPPSDTKNQMPTHPKPQTASAHSPGFAGNMARIAQAASAGVRPCADVGQVLGASRRACGLSQRHLAQHMGVTVRTVKRWERGVCLPQGAKQLYLFAYLEIPLQSVLQLKVKSAGPHTRTLLDKFTDLRV